MPLTFSETPLYYKDSQGNYHRIMSGADMTGYARVDEESHRNILDNWYFVGGGSQLGYGTFPINQRGQSSYLGPGYGIDRWSCATSSVTALCGYSNYIVLKSSTAGSQNLLIQYIDNKELLAGKTVTISAIINGVLVQSTISIPADSSTWSSTIGSGSALVGGCAIYLRYLNSKLCFVFYASSTYVANTNILISSAKLELNSYQTLAHNEGTESSPNWVLNEIPDYGEELAKCQRYLFIVTSSSASGPVGSGYCPADGQSATFFIPLPVTMIGNASVSFDGTLYIYAPSAAGQTVASLGATAYSCGNGVIFTASVSSGTTLSRGGGYILRVNNGSKLIFSAE